MSMTCTSERKRRMYENFPTGMVFTLSKLRLESSINIDWQRSLVRWVLVTSTLESLPA